MDVKTAAILARQLITEQSESATDITIPRIQALVPVALEAWSRKAIMQPGIKELFKKQFFVEVEGGPLDLTPYTDGTKGRIDLRELRRSTLYSNAGGAGDDMPCGMKPYTWVGSFSQLKNARPMGSDFRACFLDGSMLYFKDNCRGYDFTDEISFTVVSMPADVTEIPSTLEKDFIIFLAALVMGGANAG